MYMLQIIPMETIQKFDSNGNFITKWGSQGTGNGTNSGSPI